MTNPFKLFYAPDWTFQIVHMEGGIHLEGYGLGLCIRAPLLSTENPLLAADQLIFKEDKRRRSLYYSWRSKTKLSR